jgi:oligosaccharide repeat unit polymerase
LSPTNDLSTDQKHTATRTKLRSLAFTASFCFVLALLPIVVFLSTPKKWTMLTLALVGLMLLLYPIYRGVRSGSLDIFEPPVMTALLSFEQLLRPIYWMTLDEVSIPRYTASAERVFRSCATASLWLCIGMALYFTIYYRLPPVTQFVAAFPTFPRTYSKRRYRFVVVLCVAVGVGSYAILMKTVGGLTYFLAHIYVRSEVTEGLGPIAVFVQLVSVGWIVSFCNALDRKKSLWPMVGLGVVVAIFNATLGGRGFILYPILVCLIVRHYVKSRMQISRLLLVGAAFLTFAFMFKNIRDATANPDGPTLDTFNDSGLSAADVISGFFKEQNALDMFAVMVDDMPHHVQFQFGRTWLNLLTLPVPSKLWVSKPLVLEGRYVAETYFGDHAGMPPGYAGVLFLNFSYAGVLIGFVILGIFHKALYRYLLQNQSRAMCVCMYATTVTSLYDLSNVAIMRWLYYGPFLLFAFWFLTRRSLRGRQASLRG